MKRIVLGNSIGASTQLAVELQSCHRHRILYSRRKSFFNNVLCVNSGWVVDQWDVRGE